MTEAIERLLEWVAMPIRELPAEAREILERLKAPPRLVAHLTFVHDAATEILEGLSARWKDLAIDAEAVLFGAATHDIGKVLHPGELDGPGDQHTRDGPKLLEEIGIVPARARFARTHETWERESGLTIEDIVVALADTCWKGARDETLESLLASRIADSQNIARWEAFSGLDEIITRIAERADERLAE